MTFNQWASSQDIDMHSKMALEAVWNEIIRAGNSPTKAANLLEDVLEPMERRRREDVREAQSYVRW